MMRITLQAKSPHPLSSSRSNTLPLSVTIRPANNVLGTFEYQTDSNALLRFLRQKTDLSGHVLDTFRTDLELSTLGRLPVINLKEEVLEELGYFID